MLYDYHCPKCGVYYQDIVQGANDDHVYECPTCKVWCTRVFSMPTISENKTPGFYSEQLGRNVKDYNDLENGLEEIRYKHGLNPHLGNNKDPEQKWVDELETAKTERFRKQAEVEEGYTEDGYYDNVQTFDPDNDVLGV